MRPLIAVVVAIGIVSGYYLLTGDDGFFRFGPGNDQGVGVPVYTVIATVFAMVIGIVFGSLHDQLLGRKRVAIGKEIVRLTQSPRLFRSLLASPILYVGVYVAAKTQPDLVISLMFAFQTGFFCNAIMKKKAEEMS